MAIRLLVERGLTAGTAESLTGGLVAAALTTVPGASAAFRGAIVAYAADLKASLLLVPPALLEQVGTVHADVAAAMAHGARKRLAVDVAVATTGVAGPDPVDGHPVGTVHIAVSVRSPAGALSQRAGHWPGPSVRARARLAHRELHLAGSRDEIRLATVGHALDLLVGALMEDQR